MEDRSARRPDDNQQNTKEERKRTSRHFGGCAGEAGKPPVRSFPWRVAIEQRRGEARGKHERHSARRIIYRMAIVGIDEAEIPELGALIEIRYALPHHAQESLWQTVDGGGGCDDVSIEADTNKIRGCERMSVKLANAERRSPSLLGFLDFSG